MGKLEGPPTFTPYERPIQPLNLFQQRLPTDEGQLHFLVPAGVGDNLWIISKHWKTCMERDVVFWLPAGEQKRSGDVFRMAGLRYGYLPNLSTEWIWSRPGEPPIPAGGAVLSMQPNRHLEHGHRIEKWYPDLEFRNPCEFIEIQTAVPTLERGRYVVGFMSQVGYMEYGGNLKAAQWARIWRQVEKDVGPVLIIGAGKDVEFAEEVFKFYAPRIEPAFNCSLDQVAAIMAGSAMVLGAHAGPLILSVYMGIPTLHAYPRWLAPMPGTWEAEGNTWGACFLDELENVVRDGIRFEGLKSAEKIREADRMPLTFEGEQHPRWQQNKNGASPTLPPLNPDTGMAETDTLRARNGSGHAAEPDKFSWTEEGKVARV